MRPQVFFRLFLSLIYDITAPDKYLDPFNSAILGALVDTFHSLRPSRIPQFAFAWLELIAHRAFMPKVRPECEIGRAVGAGPGMRVRLTDVHRPRALGVCWRPATVDAVQDEGLALVPTSAGGLVQVLCALPADGGND